jgi:type IV secretion system protein TrbL
VLVALFMKAAGTRSWFFMSLIQICAFVAGGVTFVIFLAIAVMLLLCQLELTAVIVLGSIVLIFSVLPWVLPSLQRYALTALNLGVKLLTLFAVIGIGLIAATTWTQDFAGVVNGAGVTAFQQVFLPFGEIVLFGIMAYALPNRIAGLVSGGSGPSMGLGEMFLGAAAAEGGAAARSGAQQAITAGVGAASSAVGTAAGTAARHVRNMLLQS